MQRVKVLKSGQFRFIKNVKGGAKPKPAKAKPRGKTRGTSPGRRNPKMARKKSSIVNRAVNLGLLLLGFSRVIELALRRNFNGIVFEATAGMAGVGGGKLNLPAAGRLYGPMIASFVLFEVKKMAMKKFRF